MILSMVWVGFWKGIMHRMCSFSGGGASPMIMAGGIEREG